MPRECNCAGGVCGPQPSEFAASELFTLAGTGTAKSWDEWIAERIDQDELARWKADLHKPAPPRKYHSDTHTDVKMHLGGIGTGNFEIGSDGQLTTWQLFNTLRDGYVPCFFGVKAGKTAKLLQTKGGPNIPRVKAIEMTGEYPFAVLKYQDDDLPVRLELTAFTPFAPLDTDLSSLPVACFVFKVHNPTRQTQTVSLVGMMQNPVGYDAMGVPISFNSVGFNDVPAVLDNHRPNFGGNYNEVHKDGKSTILAMRAKPGAEPTIDKPLHIFTNLDVRALNSPFDDRPKELTVTGIDRLMDKDIATGPGDLIWLEDAAVDLNASVLAAARDAVRNGATLVFSGKTMPLLAHYATVTGGKPLEKVEFRKDILFEDFESGYGQWKVEGTAFGQRPARGTLPNQQQVTGFLGRGVVNSFRNGDETTGRLTSKTFTVERNFIRFLVGGGHWDNTQIRLVVDGKVVRATSGKDNEKLEPASWDVREFLGNQAHIEIVDENTGGWGHINLDQIEFSDLPANRAVLEILDELLPIRFSAIRPLDSDRHTVAIEGVTNKDGVTEATIDGILYTGKVALGTGRTVVYGGSILPPEHIELTGARQRAYADMPGFPTRYRAPQTQSAKAPGFGTLTLTTTGPKRGAYAQFTDWKEAWGLFVEHQFANGFKAELGAPTAAGETYNGALTSTVEVGPGKTVEVPFFLAWHYPNKYNAGGVWMGNHYATKWKDALEVARHVAVNFATMREKTERFRRVMYDTTLPYWFTDCLTSQAAIIRHVGVVFRIANGDTYGWEGSNGCCQPTCTHVWGYEQTLSRLFPDLERDMRRIDYKHQQRADGGINNRTDTPSPPRPTGEQPFVDGHASCILKAYREAMNHPDEAWLREYWPGIRKAVEYLIARDAATSEGRPDGTLSDDQWNTYDEALHGITTFMSGYYLAALRAGEDLAHRMGDHEAGNRYRQVFETGRNKLIQTCWNGEYFHQNLPGYEKMHGEVGPGCMSDQMIGQWWAHQLGLGYLFPKEMVVSSLQSVFKYNWKPDLTGWRHMPRAFAGDKDRGLIICTWPKGGRPEHVMLYSDEVWTGIEYQVASHMLYEGMIDEGLAIIKGARDRYDGVPRAPIPRNPFNEIECGGHYARAMSSWSCLLALSGYEVDAPSGHLRFTPRYTPENFKSFFAGPEGWGTLRQTRRGNSQRNEVAVEEGTLRVSRLHLTPPTTPKRVSASVGGKNVPAQLVHAMEGIYVSLSGPVTVPKGQKLIVSLS